MEAPYVHIGIMVPDLEAAIESYAPLGVTFMQPQTVQVHRLLDEGQESTIDLRIAFSHQGPPHWELLEVVGDGIYGPAQTGGLHHVAVLDPDPEKRFEELARSGIRMTAAQYREDGTMIVGYADPEPFGGIRIELLHEPVQDAILAWIAGEEASP
jgi:catechol 2,3-dioxygenase-like lactoylglutathione lyase family enzyme